MFPYPLEQELTTVLQRGKPQHWWMDAECVLGITFSVLGICCPVPFWTHYHPPICLLSRLKGLQLPLTYSRVWPRLSSSTYISHFTYRYCQVSPFFVFSDLWPWAPSYSFFFLTYLFCEYSCLCTCVEVTRQLANSWSSPSTMWVPRTDLRSSTLADRTLVHWAIPPVHF